MSDNSIPTLTKPLYFDSHYSTGFNSLTTTVFQEKKKRSSHLYKLDLEFVLCYVKLTCHSCIERNLKGVLKQ